jgi:predicted 2-oxoglutarate/Fe(II)-dependent dioxygenase YbiX
VGNICKTHIDECDYRSGFCWVVAFGSFIGGNLKLDDLCIEFTMGVGLLIAFKSNEIWHSVRPVTSGYRYSIVLFTDDAMMSDTSAGL